MFSLTVATESPPPTSPLRQAHLDSPVQRDASANANNGANPHLDSPGKEGMDVVVVDEHHGEGTLVEGQEDAAIY